MKKIKLSESQFLRLFEVAPDGTAFSNGDIKEYPNSEISTTATITNSDGEPKYGKPHLTGADRTANKLSNQGMLSNGRAVNSRQF